MLTAVKESRATPREALSEPVLIRPCDLLVPEEVCTTANVSRSGVYFVTARPHYAVGMNVIITLNFGPEDPTHHERIGDVVRVDALDDHKWGVAIRILLQSNPGIYSGT